MVQVAPSQDIPPWIHHAMACLTTWPREKQSGIVNYYVANGQHQNTEIYVKTEILTKIWKKAPIK